MGFEFLSAFKSPYAGRDFASNIDARIAAQRRAEQELYARELISKRLYAPKTAEEMAEGTVAPLSIEQKANLYRDQNLPEAVGKESAALDALPLTRNMPQLFTPATAAVGASPAGPATTDGAINLLSKITPATPAAGQDASVSAGQSRDVSRSEKTVAGAGTPQGNSVVDRTLELLTKSPVRDFRAESMASQLGDLRQELILDPSLNAGIVDPLLSGSIEQYSGAAKSAQDAQDKFRTVQLKEASDLWQAQQKALAQKDVAKISASAKKGSDMARIASAEIAAGASRYHTQMLLYHVAARLKASLAQTAAFNQRTATIIPASATAAMLMGKPDLMNSIQAINSGLAAEADFLSREGSRLEMLGGLVGAGDQQGQAENVNAGAISSQLDVLHRRQAAFERKMELEEEKRTLVDKASNYFRSNPKATTSPELERINAITREQNQSSVEFNGVQIPLLTRASFVVGAGGGGRTRSTATGPAAPAAEPKSSDFQTPGAYFAALKAWRAGKK